MSIQTISTLTDGTTYYSQTSVLDGTSFKMIFRWNRTDAHWYLSVRTEADEVIKGCEGIRLVQRGYPLRRVYDPKRPLGELFVSSELDTEPGLTTLGIDTLLLYIPKADFDEVFNVG